jgi:hypothetical protein
MQNRRFLKTVCSICLFTVCGIDSLLAAAGKSQGGILTNFEVIERISSEAAQDIIAQIGALQQGETVLLNKTKSAGTVDFIMENALTTGMRDVGIMLAVETPNRDASAAQAKHYRLSYQIIRLSLSYPQVVRKWWLGPRQVTRAARADIFTQFIDLTTGDIVWVRESHKTYRDTIDYSLLKSVEDAQYDFTRPPHSEFKMMRLFEPLIVGGIVVGLVYLFFSNQKQ